MILFVTVGTTEFNQLVSLISSEGLPILKSHGFNKVVIQVGKGDPPNESCVPGIEVEHYTFKPSTYDDIKAASLVISHAGAGTVLDVMDQHKPFIAVVNPVLMGNHQTELALHLHRLGHLQYCTPEILIVERRGCPLFLGRRPTVVEDVNLTKICRRCRNVNVWGIRGKFYRSHPGDVNEKITEIDVNMFLFTFHENMTSLGTSYILRLKNGDQRG